LIGGDWRALEPDEKELAARLSQAVTEAAIAEQETVIGRLERTGVRVVTLLDEDYPYTLRLAFNRPPMLFVSGSLQPSNRHAVAVVGTRQAGHVALARAAELAGELVELDFTVVSGLARGVDTAAHRAALAAGGRTIAVMGTGINRVYPPENRQLADEIRSRGALVSQFWPDTPPTKFTFPLRNAVLSGMSVGVVVIEGAERSGSSMQARIALEQVRPLFFVEGLSAEEAWARTYLDQGRAKVVSSAGEIAQATVHLTEPPSWLTLA
jgi:DNA processing protein